MKQLSIVKYAPQCSDQKQRFIYLGEIPNMPGFSAVLPTNGDLRQPRITETEYLVEIPIIPTSKNVAKPDDYPFGIDYKHIDI